MCEGGTLPCRFASCTHNGVWLHYDPDEFAALSDDDAVAVIESLTIANSCVLDVADRGEHTEEEIGELCGVTQSAVSQTLTTAYERLGGVVSRDGDLVQRSLFGIAKAIRRERRRAKVRPETVPVSQLQLFSEEW